MVVSPGQESGDFYIYLNTLDSGKANMLRDKLIDEIPDVHIITREVDNPVYYLDLEYPDGSSSLNVVLIGEPENDPELGSVTIKRKERLV